MSSTFSPRTVNKHQNCANPLFERWLDEWRVEAQENNLDLQYCYAKALHSLRKYPIKLNSGKECLILNNFGINLCNKLDRKLAEYHKNGDQSCLGIIHTTTVKKTIKRKLKNVSQDDSKLGDLSPCPKRVQKVTISNTKSPNSKKSTKSYVPAYRSGPYALLITLLKEESTPNNPGFCLKTELQHKAQSLCDMSMTKPDPGCFYTAWSSMAQLIKKGFVTKNGKKSKYSLTVAGRELAYKLEDCLEKKPLRVSTADSVKPLLACDRRSDIRYIPRKNSSNEERISSLAQSSTFERADAFGDVQWVNLTDSDVQIDADRFEYKKLSSQKASKFVETSDFSNDPVNDSRAPTNTSNDCSEQLIFIPGEFEIILLVDIGETIGHKKRHLDETVRDLTEQKTNFEIRRLSIGDFVWIARSKDNRELVLPYIVERKRMDDLADSIKGDRFREQKFRLRKCGLTNVIYLIEKYGKNDMGFGLPVNTLGQAAINTQLVDNFFVKNTNHHGHSIMYLSTFTKLLTDEFKKKTLISCPKNNLPPFDIEDDMTSLMTFEEFNKSSIKRKELAVNEMFIKQLIQLRGMSVEKAIAITEKYPSPRDLMKAFEINEKPELLLAKMRCNASQRNIGPKISKTLYKLYLNDNFTI